MILINLLPYREARRMALLQKIFLAWGAALVVGLIAAWLVDNEMLERLQRLSDQKDQNQRVIVLLDQKLGEAKDIKEKRALLQARLEAIEELQRQRRVTLNILDQISLRIPEKVWINSLNTSNEDVRVTGIAQSNSEVARFMDNLEDSPLFKAVFLNQTSQTRVRTHALKSFSLRIELLPPEQDEGEDDQPGGG